MKYMLLIYADEQVQKSEAEREHCYEESTELAHRLESKGQFMAAAPLQSTSTATTVRVRGGTPLVTDGPFAETREQLGGYFLVDAKDLDVAIEIASQIPAARWGTVEVRPVVEIAGLPYGNSASQNTRKSQVFETSDLGGEFTTELREAEERMRAQIAEYRQR